MNICIFGASSDDIDQAYMDAVFNLGKKLAERGHTLVFGAGARGLMGAAARGASTGNGEIVGVAPTFFNVDGIIYDKCTELIRTETMRERKQIMEDRSDAFIMVPGGIGTFEEFFEVLTLKQLGRHGKAIIVYNQDGFFDSLFQMMDECVEKGFMNHATNEIYQVMTDTDEILSYLDGYTPEVGKVFKF